MRAITRCPREDRQCGETRGAGEKIELRRTPAANPGWLSVDRSDQTEAEHRFAERQSGVALQDRYPQPDRRYATGTTMRTDLADAEDCAGNRQGQCRTHDDRQIEEEAAAADAPAHPDNVVNGRAGGWCGPGGDRWGRGDWYLSVGDGASTRWCSTERWGAVPTRIVRTKSRLLPIR